MAEESDDLVIEEPVAQIEAREERKTVEEVKKREEAERGEKR